MSRGMLVLAIWLIAIGLFPLLGIRFQGSEAILAIVGIIAGLLILIDQKGVKLGSNIGMLLLSAWLILAGVVNLVSVRGLPTTLLAVLALGAGILLLLRR